MSEVQYNITSTNFTYNLPFDVQQFSIRNPTPYTMYVNDSGANPTLTQYRYIIQPNSDYNSGLLNSRTFSIYIPATTFVNTAQITFYDHKHSEASNTPYLNTQTVKGGISYPVTAQAVLDSSGGFSRVLLPALNFNNFLPAYFMVGGVTFGGVSMGGFAGIPYALSYESENFGSEPYPLIFGGGNFGWPTISHIVPPILNQDLNIYLYTTAEFASSNFLVDVAYSNQNIPALNTTKTRKIPFTGAIGSKIINGCLVPPAFYYDIVLQPKNTTGAVNFTVTVLFEATDILGHNKLTILNQTFTLGSFTNLTLLRALEPVLVLNPEYRFFKITVTNTVATNPFDVLINLWEYA